VPKIADIAGAAVLVFPNDHPPPHVHVHYQGRAIRLRIVDAAPLDRAPGFPPRVLRDVTAWLFGNRDLAIQAWAAFHP
jgi:hypothetical protein